MVKQEKGNKFIYKNIYYISVKIDCVKLWFFQGVNEKIMESWNINYIFCYNLLKFRLYILLKYRFLNCFSKYRKKHGGMFLY